jgi:DMSO reductase family type II enzyme iron-sulfur subunit
MVFDLNKCLGCQTCSIACKTLWTDGEGMEHMWWNVVNTLPGKGSPRNWMEAGGGFGADGAPRASALPTDEDFGVAWDYNYDAVWNGAGNVLEKDRDVSWGMNWDEDEGDGEWPNSYFFYLPRICMHCTRPACLEACPRSAIYKREDNGTVLIDEERCHGYRFCAEACPYKRIYFNPQRRISQKCVLCFARVEQGVAPACMRQCPGRIRSFGYLDDEDSAVHKLVKKWKVAIPLHPEFGTEPNLFYVPPLAPPRLDAQGDVDEQQPRIPSAYLEWLFGRDVWRALDTLKSEIDKRSRGEASELMDILIAYRQQDMFGGFKRDPGELERTPGHVRSGPLESPRSRM